VIGGGTKPGLVVKKGKNYGIAYSVDTAKPVKRAMTNVLGQYMGARTVGREVWGGNRSDGTPGKGRKE